MRFELRERLTLALASVLLASFALNGWHHYKEREQDLSAEHQFRLQQHAQRIAYELNQSPSKTQWRPILQEHVANNGVDFAQALINGKAVSAGESDPLLPSFTLTMSNNRSITVSAAPAYRQKLAGLRLQLTSYAAAQIGVICLVFYLVLGKTVTNPLNEVRTAMRKIRETLVDEFPDESANDYLKITHHFRSLHKLQQRTQDQFNYRIGNAQSELIKTKKILDKHKDRLQRLKDRYSKVSLYDTLTGVKNRIAFDQQLECAQKEIEKGEGLSVCIVEIDQIKSVNDTYGLTMGNRLIEYCARLLQKYKKNNQSLFRIGGSKFALICQHGDKEKVYIQMEYIRNKIECSPLQNRQQEIAISVSIGTASYPNTYKVDNAEELFKSAEVALLYSREHGGNLCTQFEFMMSSFAAQNNETLCRSQSE